MIGVVFYCEGDELDRLAVEQLDGLGCCVEGDPLGVVHMGNQCCWRVGFFADLPNQQGGMTAFGDGGLIRLDGDGGCAKVQIQDGSIGKGCGLLMVVDGLGDGDACKEVFRWGCSAIKIISPASSSAVRPDAAAVEAACTDGDELAFGWCCLVTAIISPAAGGVVCLDGAAVGSAYTDGDELAFGW